MGYLQALSLGGRRDLVDRKEGEAKRRVAMHSNANISKVHNNETLNASLYEVLFGTQHFARLYLDIVSRTISFAWNGLLDFNKLSEEVLHILPRQLGPEFKHISSIRVHWIHVDNATPSPSAVTKYVDSIEHSGSGDPELYVEEIDALSPEATADIFRRIRNAQFVRCDAFLFAASSFSVTADHSAAASVPEIGVQLPFHLITRQSMHGLFNWSLHHHGGLRSNRHNFNVEQAVDVVYREFVGHL